MAPPGFGACGMIFAGSSILMFLFKEIKGPNRVCADDCSFCGSPCDSCLYAPVGNFGVVGSVTVFCMEPVFGSGFSGKPKGKPKPFWGVPIPS